MRVNHTVRVRVRVRVRVSPNPTHNTSHIPLTKSYDETMGWK